MKKRKPFAQAGAYCESRLTIRLLAAIARCTTPLLRQFNPCLGRLFLLWAVCLAMPFPAKSEQDLRTVAAIRDLSVEQTRQKIPAHLKGVVTFFDGQLYSYFLQDETAGIYLQVPTNQTLPSLNSGQVIEVTGYSSPGEYAPVVMVNSWRAVGTAPLPAPKVVTYEQLASGTEDSQFIEITGVVRSVKPVENLPYRLIEIATGGGRLLVYAQDLPVKQMDELLDSTIRVRGVCSTKFNRKRQLFAIRIMVPRPEDLQIEVPAARDPFAIAARPIGSLLQFSPQQTYGHRVKVTGTVIYNFPGEVAYLDDGEQGVKILTEETNALQIGDRVEALGFVSEGEYTPVLQDGVFRKVASGLPPAPSILSPDEVLKGNHDSRLVQVSGEVLDRAQHGGERYLILHDGDFIFHAYLKPAGKVDPFADLANGSRVSVTGVCQIDPGDWYAGEAWRAKAFNLQLRSAADVILLTAPSWWTLQKLLWIAAGLGFAMLAAFGWVAVLHRQVAERSRELEIQIQGRQQAERRREMEQERARVAHDLHDDLGAGLTEVNMLTALVKSQTTSPPEKERYLTELTETARRMVTSLDEIVWAVNSRNDTIASLASYFGSYAQRLLDLAGVACGLDIDEELPEHPLDPKFRQEVFFAFKEALTNVVRHARATQVWLRISVRNGRLAVAVADNGRGFDLTARHAGSNGLASMKERLNRLGGECEMESVAGKGTTVRFTAPLPERLL
jgi:signal transduction histidine kinase